MAKVSASLSENFQAVLFCSVLFLYAVPGFKSYAAAQYTKYTRGILSNLTTVVFHISTLYVWNKRRKRISIGEIVSLVSTVRYGAFERGLERGSEWEVRGVE
ncbi:hypothetical protein B0H16DRAFT_226045 [Mycena metata]|uniref:Uncharacterized protein n=1 Tax=Mycena metata TaxID=1033252 RepID=A0AAD7HXL7_9AGAR|nr:hypothetical protein B0H16DRAFT_226045 [Mycena metata]